MFYSTEQSEPIQPDVEYQMSWGAISEMGPVSIRTSNLEQSVVDATQILGLRETKRTDGVSYLAAADVHHELTYVESDVDGLEALGLIAANGDALRDIRRRVEDEGFLVVSEKPTGEGVEDGFTFIGPEASPSKFPWACRRPASPPRASVRTATATSTSIHRTTTEWCNS